MLRKFLALALLSVALTGWAVADDGHRSSAVTIMTQNLDDGTDQTYIVAALAVPDFPLSVPQAVDLTVAELQASNFEGRAKLLARQIARERPDLLAVQEASLWRTGPTPDTATTVLFDPLALLLSALDKHGVPYDVVAVNRLSDLALPGDQIGGVLRFTDRNAVLVRSDLRAPHFHLSNVHAHTFDAAFPFAGLTITAGWISADVHVGNDRFRFFATHLESPVGGLPEATAVQVAQAQELIHEMNEARMPVVLCGDFNSDALHGGFVDDTPTVGVLEAAGYAEVWPKTHRRRDLGLTWPLFLEDQFPDGGLPPPFFAPSQPFERIDLFFSRNIDVVSSEQVLAPAHGADLPSFGSDHAGVIAVFRP